MSITPKQKFLLVAPAIVLPFLFLIFSVLGGGKGSKKDKAANALGLNTQLPGVYIDPRKALMNKMSAYLHADEDSLRKKESQQRDPYHPYLATGKPMDSAHRSGGFRPVVKTDPKADELLRQLNRLQISLREPPAPLQASPPAPARVMPSFQMQAARARPADTPANDPQLERLNTMLDKVIRIQHPGEGKLTSGIAGNSGAEEVLPADSASNAIAAVVPMDQTLVAGGTIALRLSEDVLIHGVAIGSGQWVYGTVSISGDRMLVHIRSLRSGRNLYNTDLQVYDLDGLPGIHIPDMLSQDVAKESANESVNGLNVGTYDPSLGAQAANAGIQAAKTLFGRKVRQVKVSVRAGYQVLLRNTQAKTVKAAAPEAPQQTPPVRPEDSISFFPGGSFLRRCRVDGMELDLQGIYLKDSLLWFALRWQNHSPIGYAPDYCRWVIRDRRSFKRMAEQELPLDPVVAPVLKNVAGDSTLDQWTGFRPFALAKDKELVLEVGEKNGGRALTLVIDHKRILKAKREEP